MDFLDALNRWWPAISSLVLLVWAVIHVLIMSTLASKRDLAGAQERAHADYDSLHDQIGTLDRRQTVTEAKVERIEQGQHEVATKGDIADVRAWIQDIKVDLTRIERHLLRSDTE